LLAGFQLTEDCSGLLLDLVQQLTSDSEEDKNNLLEACVQSLEKFADTSDTRTPMFVFERLCNTIRPAAPEVEALLHLEKIESQEEFIRGTMTKNPYQSAEIGLLMRDVKNKICTDLELYGLLEDDNGMELLVCDKIIALDLNIKEIYEQVWRKENPGEHSPMVVVFRLQGLDGEATEERVDHLNDAEQEEGDPEEGKLFSLFHLFPFQNTLFFSFKIQCIRALMLLARLEDFLSAFITWARFAT